ncbi:unnamed protein product [Acanthoscelides obtectus]|uniref:Uncharacterized protein n=1 Tax=Acanthoscelides obtectus TaxID=200917 RepID=A0A9P0LXG0_ACAOB|nr:unnamed protein product [Acanthoscelides obtectus]CAK1669085.1 Protein FAM200B [Acanthoscelides obtectus]
MVSTHCVIHRQALASTLPPKLRQTLDLAIRIVNYIKSSALNIRWLSKGNILARLYELKERYIPFLEFKEKHDFLTMFKDDTFQWRLAYLTDIFDSLNELNLKLQGRNNAI